MDRYKYVEFPLWCFFNIHGDLWIFVLFVHYTQKPCNKTCWVTKKMVVLILCLIFCDFPINSCLFFIVFKAALIQKLLWRPYIFKCPLQTTIALLTFAKNWVDNLWLFIFNQETRVTFKSSSPGQNDRHFADDTFMWLFSGKKVLYFD